MHCPWTNVRWFENHSDLRSMEAFRMCVIPEWMLCWPIVLNKADLFICFNFNRTNLQNKDIILDPWLPILYDTIFILAQITQRTSAKHLYIGRWELSRLTIQRAWPPPICALLHNFNDIPFIQGQFIRILSRIAVQSADYTMLILIVRCFCTRYWNLNWTNFAISCLSKIKQLSKILDTSTQKLNSSSYLSSLMPFFAIRIVTWCDLVWIHRI
jgi:hypothetical protein